MSDSPPSSEFTGADETARLLVQYHELAELAGELAHEIKNPLSVIRMNMDLLEEDLVAPETPRERRVLQKIAVVSQQCTRLENLLNDFLKFAKMRQLDLRSGSLNEQIELVLDLFAPQARDQGVEVRKYLDPDLPSILLHAESLQAALVNLVKNALEAMPHGGELMVRTHPTRTGVALDMIDTGQGMDENTLFRMFEAFYSTKTNGTGLGLPTAKKIVEAHGGRIDVQSAPGLGTKFTLEFPTPARLPEASGS